MYLNVYLVNFYALNILVMIFSYLKLIHSSLNAAYKLQISSNHLLLNCISLILNSHRTHSTTNNSSRPVSNTSKIGITSDSYLSGGLYSCDTNDDLRKIVMNFIKHIPDAPVIGLTKSQKKKLNLTANITQPELNSAHIINIEDFTNVIPYFFIPIEKLLDQLEGYTESHLLHYLAPSKAVQILTLESIDDETTGTKYIRLYGANGTVSLADTTSYMSYPEYQPDINKALEWYVFLRENAPDKGINWMPLSKIIQNAPKKLVENLHPFKNTEMILFFGQFQHLFCICLDQGGYVSCISYTNNSNEDKYNKDPFNVFMTLQKNIELNHITSPCPISCNEIYRLFSVDYAISRRDITDVWDEINEYSKKQIINLYKPLLDMVLSNNNISTEYTDKDLFKVMLGQHSKMFYMEGELLMTQRTKTSESFKHLSLSKRLEIASTNRSRDVRKYRRLLAMKENPDHPMLFFFFFNIYMPTNPVDIYVS